MDQWSVQIKSGIVFASKILEFVEIMARFSTANTMQIGVNELSID